MLMPKKVKYRKQQRGRMRGKAWRGSTLEFGDYGLKTLDAVNGYAGQAREIRPSLREFEALLDAETKLTAQV